jgi:CheY-like chemotaxis protein
MILLDRSNISKLLSFLPTIKKDLKSWGLVDIALTGRTKHNVMLIAKKIEDALGSRDGALFVHDEKHIISFLRHSLSANDCREAIATAIVQCLPEYSCDVVSSALSTEGLQKIEIRLSHSVSSGKNATARSTLYCHRAERHENVLMLVDDDRYLIEILARSLAKFGTCIPVYDGAQSLDAYLENVPDIVFLDISLPGKSGLEILDLVMKYDHDAHVVMLTSLKTTDHVVAAKSKGAKSFIGKPFDVSRLESEIFNCPTIRRSAPR